MINEFSLIVFYVESTRTCFKKMKKLVKKYAGKIFYIIGRIDSKYPNPNALSLIFDEDNVIHRVFSIKEFIEECMKEYK